MLSGYKIDWSVTDNFKFGLVECVGCGVWCGVCVLYVLFLI